MQVARQPPVRAARRKAAMAALSLGWLAALSACTGDSQTTEPDTSSSITGPGHVGLAATVQQQRLDIGTRRIGLELTTDDRTTVHVSAVQLITDAFTQKPPTPKDTDFVPGRTIDLVVLYGDPICRADVSPDDAVVRVHYDVDGARGEQTLSVDGHGVGVLSRLRDSYCAEQRLARAASLRYQRSFHRERVGGDLVLVGNLVLRRPADGGSGQPVRIRSLLGSVILDLKPLSGSGPRWGRLTRADAVAQAPIELVAGRTCTAHGLSGTQQPFIFSAYVKVGNAPLYRQIIEPPKPLQRQALALIHDVCF